MSQTGVGQRDPLPSCWPAALTVPAHLLPMPEPQALQLPGLLLPRGLQLPLVGPAQALQLPSQVPQQRGPLCPLLHKGGRQ